MPVRRRASKRRIDPVAEARAWTCMFKCGFDLLCELHWLGFEDRDAIHAAAPDAWKRLGRIYLDHRLGDDLNGDEEWALKEFGEPE